jgi:hypothetical protein
LQLRRRSTLNLRRRARRLCLTGETAEVISIPQVQIANSDDLGHPVS